MISSVRGAVAEIQKEAVNALKTPCFSHKLNNSIARSSNVTTIRDAVSIIKEVISFFKPHPKRNTVLMRKLGCGLTSLCETRWVERHEGVLQFSVDLDKIVETLHIISKCRDPSTASKASSLIFCLCNPQFIISLFYLSDLLTVTHSLSQLLQKTNFDVNESSMHVKNTICQFTNRRENMDASFSLIWQRIMHLADILGVELTVPRIPRRGGRQVYRNNHEADRAEQYFRISIYAPLLDNVLQDMRERFSKDTLDIFKLGVIIPENILKISDSACNESITVLLNTFEYAVEQEKAIASQHLKNELALWKEKWLQIKENFPKTAVDVLALCDKDVYPIIYKFLHILATLSVTTACPEISFSTLRRLKTYLRSTMRENRLLGLALLNIHRSIEVDIEEVITRFAKTGHRKQFSI